MADIYVRSTDGNNADSGATWALAKADLHTTTWAAGDRIFVSQANAQSTAAGITIASAGTNASPTQILCVSDAAEPPTAVATTGTVTTTGASQIIITGAVYVHGLTFFGGTGATSNGAISMSANGLQQTYRLCSFQTVNTHSNSDINIGSTSGGNYIRVRWEDCTVKVSAVGQQVVCSQARFDWHGGSWLSGGTTPTALFTFAGDGGVMDIAGVDFSGLGTTFNIFSGANFPAKGVVRNCKLPASWSGVLGSPTGPAARYEMYNCDSGDTNYRLWVQDSSGTIRDETTIVRTGGASDGTTPISWKMTSDADAEYPLIVLRAPEIVIWNDTVGSAKTVTIEVITDNVTLTNAEAWIEVQHLGTSGFPLGSFINDAKADVLVGALAQDSSSETWTTTGLTTPVKQQLSVTFTPQEKGFFHIVPCLAKASTTMYVCPKAKVT